MLGILNCNTAALQHNLYPNDQNLSNTKSKRSIYVLKALTRRQIPNRWQF